VVLRLGAPHEGTLKIDGVVEATREVTVDAGFSEEVIFNISRDAPGTYFIEVDGLTSSFIVKEEVVPLRIPKPINCGLIGGIVGGVSVVSLLVYFLLVRKRLVANK